MYIEPTIPNDVKKVYFEIGNKKIHVKYHDSLRVDRVLIALVETGGRNYQRIAAFRAKDLGLEYFSEDPQCLLEAAFAAKELIEKAWGKEKNTWADWPKTI